MTSPPSGTSVLAPDLTTEDVRVLRALPASNAAGHRATTLAEQLDKTAVVRPWLTVNGLHVLGYVTSTNGYWKRTTTGDAYLHNLDAPPAHQESFA